METRCDIRISIYDHTGRLLRVIANQSMQAGQHTLPVDLSAYKTSMYTAVFEVNGRIAHAQKVVRMAQ
ncbi:MAG: hypothetical protein P1P82_15680 [Bacteroidales bacterium]|nr:hypothetical protein [Bacteroidales bacterium]